jgi:hypothetical protein
MGAIVGLPPELLGDEVLFRALRTRDQQTDKRRAFLLRADERNTGLSVSYNCTSDSCEYRLKKTYGVLSVIARMVKGLGLSVIPDEPTHANITGIPHEEDDAEKAFLIAGQLCDIAETVREGLRYRPQL